MTEQDTSKDASTTKNFGTAEEEMQKIKDDKAALGEVQKETAANRPTDGATAEHSSGVNAAHEEPIDPKMPEMPPA